MKRYGGLWERICSRGNIELAADNAIRGKGKRRDVRRFKERRTEFLDTIETELRTETYHFGPLASFVVHEPKERIIHHPRTLKERIIHHCIMNVIVPLLTKKFTSDVHGSVAGRGVTSMGKKMKAVLRTHPDWYFAQTDIHHFYASVDHDLLKDACRRVFKDPPLLRILDAIIDANQEGLAIGVYPSQYLANLFLMTFDHWVKEEARGPYYFRYMDDMVFIVPTKEEAHKLLAKVKEKVSELKLEIKPSARIAPVSTGIDVTGYIYYPTHTRLRKRIKEHMKRKARLALTLDDKGMKMALASHYGWAKHADCRNLLRTILGERYAIFNNGMNYKRLGDIKEANSWFGLPRSARQSIVSLEGQEIILFEFLDITIKGEDKVAVRFAFPDTEDDMHYFITRSAVVKDRLEKNRNELPFIATIKKVNKYYCFE